MKVCATPSCPTLIPKGAYKGRCPACNKAADQARGTPDARGYDQQHRRTRAWWQARIDEGEQVKCWRCGQRITASDPMHLGHDDTDRAITRGPEHAQCNLSAAGRSAHR